MSYKKTLQKATSIAVASEIILGKAVSTRTLSEIACFIHISTDAREKNRFMANMGEGLVDIARKFLKF